MERTSVPDVLEIIGLEKIIIGIENRTDRKEKYVAKHAEIVQEKQFQIFHSGRKV